MRYYPGIMLIIIVSLLSLTACSEAEQAPVDYLFDGVVLETGLEINEEREIINPSRTFRPSADIYFHYRHYRPFDNEEIVVQLVDLSNDKVLARNVYSIEQGEKSIMDIIWFGSPGRYKIVVSVNDTLKAVREVVIE